MEFDSSILDMLAENKSRRNMNDENDEEGMENGM
jgi:hypothetical protein